MKLKQYVYFAIWSLNTSTSEISDRIGLTADDGLVRGRRSPEHDVPRQHTWKIRSRDEKATVDDQISDVLSHIAPHEHAIAKLLADLGPGGGAKLQVVRYLNDEREPERYEEPLGFVLDLPCLQLLVRLEAAVDVDEYDSAVEYP